MEDFSLEATEAVKQFVRFPNFQNITIFSCSRALFHQTTMFSPGWIFQSTYQVIRLSEQSSLVPWYLLIFAVLFLLENYISSFAQTNNIPGQTLHDTFRNPCFILMTTMFHLPLISNFLSFRTCTACFAFWFGSWSLDSAAGGYFLHWCISHNNWCCVSFKNFLEIFQGTFIKIVRNL